MNMFPFTYIFSFLYHRQYFLPDLIMSNMVVISIFKNQELFTRRVHLGYLWFC